MGNAMKDINLNEWVVVKTIGGGYFGKVVGVPFSDPSSEKTIKDFKSRVYNAIAADGWLELFPCFDFMSPLRPIQDRASGTVSLVRDPIITAVDFSTDFVPVSVYPSAIVFLASLSDLDKQTYKGFIEQTSERMMQTRASASGIVLPGNGSGARG